MDHAWLIVIGIPLGILIVYILARVAALGVMKSIRESRKRERV